MGSPGGRCRGCWRLQGWRLHFDERGAYSSPSMSFQIAQACRVNCLILARVKGPKISPDLLKEGVLWPLLSPHYRIGCALPENTGGGSSDPLVEEKMQNGHIWAFLPISFDGGQIKIYLLFMKCSQRCLLWENRGGGAFQTPYFSPKFEFSPAWSRVSCSQREGCWFSRHLSQSVSGGGRERQRGHISEVMWQMSPSPCMYPLLDCVTNVTFWLNRRILALCGEYLQKRE